MMTRLFKGDRWTRLYGSPIPTGAAVVVVRFYPRRRVMVNYQGERFLTMLWCLIMEAENAASTPVWGLKVDDGFSIDDEKGDTE